MDVVRARGPLTLVSILAALLPSPARAATFHVFADGSGGFPTIQSAIDASASGDTILLHDGVYRGNGNRNLDLLGKEVVVTSVSGPDFTTIDPEYQGRAFHVHSGEGPGAVISRIHFVQGVAPVAHSVGGAIFCEGASPTLIENLFERNMALEGGAVGIDGADMLVARNRFINNACFGGCGPTDGLADQWRKGGGLFCTNATVRVVDNDFERNAGGNPMSGSAACGLGSNVTMIGNRCADHRIYDGGGTVTFIQCEVHMLANTIRHNRTSGSGGISVTECTGEIRSNLVIDNFVENGSGGISASHSDIEIAFNLLRGNHGPGMLFYGGSGIVRRNLLTRQTDGGTVVRSGIVTSNTPGLIIRENTFFENHIAPESHELRMSSACPALERCLFVATAPFPSVRCDYGCQYLGYSSDPAETYDNIFFGDSETFPEWDTPCGWWFWEQCRFEDPLLCDPAAQNLFPQPGSPCLIAFEVPWTGETIYELIGALPVGCGPEDLLDVDVPPNADVPPGGQTYRLSGFRITNVSNVDASVNYRLECDGSALHDLGEPTALVGATPVLRPGDLFVPPEAGVVVPQAGGEVYVRYRVAYAPALEIEDTLLTRVYFGAPTPVRLRALTASAHEGVVDLQWDVAVDDGLLGWDVHRTTSRAWRRINGSRLPASARRYADASVSPGEAYGYRLVAVTESGEEIAGSVDVALPAHAFFVAQNVPNPFNPKTTIRFELPEPAPTTVVIYDVGGAEVARLVDRVLPAGPHAVRWDGRLQDGTPAGSGIYLYRVRSGSRTEARKMILLR